MMLRERQYSVLLVSAATDFNRSLIAMLPESYYGPITVVSDVSSAKRKLLEKNFDITIINTPLPDEFGTRLALDICAGSSSGVLLFVKAEHYHDISEKVVPKGVLILPKPASSHMISQSLLLLCGTCERLKNIRKKTVSIEEKIEEIRLINRAKLLLIEQLKMTEAEAHRYIEKQAMDRCTTRKTIAERILSAYR